MMRLFGIQKTTLIDFPGEVAATVFFPGCNLRCPYCHNPELVLNHSPASMSGMVTWDEITSFLDKRCRVLGGVCLSGGEPLLSPHLEKAVNYIHSKGLKVKIDTNGTLPERLSDIPFDYIAMDIKTSPERYHLLTPVKVKNYGEKVKASIDIIVRKGIPHEFRTTVAPGIVTEDDIKTICKLIKKTNRYVLTQFRPGSTLDPAYGDKPPTPPSVMQAMQAIAEQEGIPCSLRYSFKGTEQEENIYSNIL
jgi:pyruvate formate lyase activating enzyme